MKRLCDYADTEVEAEHGKDPSFEREIAAQDLTFSYDGNLDALHHVSLRFVKGEKYAVVGHSGCGKSTLIKILSGYYRDYQGKYCTMKILCACWIQGTWGLSSPSSIRVCIFSMIRLKTISLWLEILMKKHGSRPYRPAVSVNFCPSWKMAWTARSAKTAIAFPAASVRESPWPEPSSGMPKSSFWTKELLLWIPKLP